MAFVRTWVSVLVIGVLVLGGASPKAQAQIIGKEKKNWLLFWKKSEPLVVVYPTDSALMADSLAKPSLVVSADSVDEKDDKKKKKGKKNVYFGYRTKKAFTRQGKGKNQIIETFHYLREFKQPNEYVLEKHYYDIKRKRIFKTRNELDPSKTKLLVLHGPYTKTRGDVVIEQGYFYVGAKHLRWETFRTDSILTDKQHYNKGFLRDALVTYYDAAKTKVKEVIPYQYGEVQGEYLKFYENGQIEWQGKYDKGRKVGIWINYFDFRGRRQFEIQYPESAFDEPFEPVLVKQYDRHGQTVFQKK
ncbi:toxin-antitoxin system YwqK family antitoxin [Rufibacter roseus]|uniref:Toxin-antitoxin system YwqK family antitoxin n=1 Tax=Rufibacter roseus TaxID=1567108 RepID=A0ABW2DEQ8_9BACT|nr:hypothetical protein [Rufibacter roseus]